MTPPPTPWQWGKLSTQTPLGALIAELNARLPQLAPVLRRAMDPTVDSVARDAAAAAQLGVNTIGGRFDGSGLLTTGMSDGATVGGVVAAYLGRQGGTVFLEVFDRLPTAATWLARFTSGVSLSLVAAGITAGKALRIGGAYQAAFAYPIPYDPSKLYRVRWRARLVGGALGRVWCGVEGVAGDGTTPVSTAGDADLEITKQHNVAANDVHLTVAGAWVEGTGWLRGSTAVGSALAAPDPLAPRALREAARYFRPHFYVLATGALVELDYLAVDVLDEDAAERVYETLAPGGGGLRPNTVDSAAVQASAIVAGKIAADAVLAANIVAGAVTAVKISVASLSAIHADLGVVTAGRMEQAAGTAGILLSGARPGTWTRYLDLTAAGSDPVLKHEAFELRADGTLWIDPTYVPQPDSPFAEVTLSAPPGLNNTVQIDYVQTRGDSVNVVARVLTPPYGFTSELGNFASGGTFGTGTASAPPGGTVDVEVVIAAFLGSQQLGGAERRAITVPIGPDA